MGIEPNPNVTKAFRLRAKAFNKIINAFDITANKCAEYPLLSFAINKLKLSFKRLFLLSSHSDG